MQGCASTRQNGETGRLRSPHARQDPGERRAGPELQIAYTQGAHGTIQSIAECAGAGDAPCKPATRFQYNQETGVNAKRRQRGLGRPDRPERRRPHGFHGHGRALPGGGRQFDPARGEAGFDIAILVASVVLPQAIGAPLSLMYSVLARYLRRAGRPSPLGEIHPRCPAGNRQPATAPMTFLSGVQGLPCGGQGIKGPNTIPTYPGLRPRWERRRPGALLRQIDRRLAVQGRRGLHPPRRHRHPASPQRCTRHARFCRCRWCTNMERSAARHRLVRDRRGGRGPAPGCGRDRAG